jgi:hypothetical protein
VFSPLPFFMNGVGVFCVSEKETVHPYPNAATHSPFFGYDSYQAGEQAVAWRAFYAESKQAGMCQ